MENSMILKQNIEETRHFLDLFSGIQCFVTLDDAKKGRPLTKQFVGNFEEFKDQLIDLNNKGAGVFFVPNLIDGTGRKTQNIMSVRAHYIDIDDGDYIEGSLPASVVVDSKNGPHAYWILREHEVVDRFTDTQRGLIQHFQSDTKVKDLPRLMRLVGFLHWKNESSPYLVKIRSIYSDRRFHSAQLRGHYPFIGTPSSEAYGRRQAVEKNSPRGDFNKIISGGCLALTQEWKRDHIAHYSRVAFLALGVNCENGEEAIFRKWPTLVTREYIEYAKGRGEKPWSCKRLQEEGICLKGKHPLYGDYCFRDKRADDGHLSKASPYRLAFGIRRAFLKDSTSPKRQDDE
jgi:hypothetical protein